MKIAVFGKTLYSGVMSALLAECGHDVYWCNIFSSSDAENYHFQDESVTQLLEQQRQEERLKFCEFSELPLTVDAYIFSFSPAEESLAFELLTQLQHRPIIHPKLMINASTLGLNGTDRFSRILPDDQWIYLPDTIQEGNALRSLTQAKQLTAGCTDPAAQIRLKEMLRPLFPLEQNFLFMPVLENFTHDIQTLANTVTNTGVKSRLLSQVWEINEQQKELMFQKFWNYYQGDLQGKRLAIWGASFKENTTRVQHSPIHVMLKALWAQGVAVALHDPQALNEIRQIYGERPDLILCENQYQAVDGAHGLCVLTAWKQYFSLDYTELLKRMTHPLLLDGRNIYDPEYVKSQGFAYMGVGR